MKKGALIVLLGPTVMLGAVGGATHPNVIVGAVLGAFAGFVVGLWGVALGCAEG